MAYARGKTWRWIAASLLATWGIVLFAEPAWAAPKDLTECQALFRKGEYQEALKSIDEAIQVGDTQEGSWLLKLQAQVALGKYPAAEQDLQIALKQHRVSVRIRLAGYDIYRLNGKTEAAKGALDEVLDLVGRTPWRYSDGENRVAVGRAALLLGDDPRQVLEIFYDKARQEQPHLRDVFLAPGDLALEKHDYRVAAETYQAGLKKFPNDPDMLYGLARSLENSDSKKATEALKAALTENPRHLPSLLFQVEELVDRERYTEADQKLDAILKINPALSEAWAYRAVIAHFANEPLVEEKYREKALGLWKDNPAVDSLIGRELAQHYRFAEGAAYQRRALASDPNYLPAKMELCHALLRLGKDDEGWRLAEEVHEGDGYDAVAFNLVTLRKNMSKFRTLDVPGFRVRMDAREADIYGPRVLALLDRAKTTLCTKYGLELKDPITVEIFPDQKDFAIRTFGLPGGAGFLGVCFGKVITANSPASQAGSPTNWEAVLWHEFCHVVTLELTRNRMPRWLSEGISVYEERLENPTWGQSMTPEYRTLILEGHLTPVSKLSGAFLAPPTPMHLQFAYYESSLVVEFFVEKLGIEPLKRLLLDLGAGMPINEALERHTGGLTKFELEFDDFAEKRAKDFGGGLVTWDKPERMPTPTDSKAAKEALDQEPKSYWRQLAYAGVLVREKNWAEARPVLESLIKAWPAADGEGSPYTLLARTYRGENDAARERETLERLAAVSNNELDAFRRLLELSIAAEDWPAVEKNAARHLAVNPLVPAPHRALALVAEKKNQNETAIASYRAVLRLEPGDLADVHYRLGKLLYAGKDPQARRHVLKALEEAPRFREAQQLLLEMRRQEKPK